MPIDPNAETGEYPLVSEAPPPAPVRVDLGALSHQGLVRANNEDGYLVVRLNRALETLLTNLPDGSVPAHFHEVSYGMLVADGMGGMAAGEIASRKALSTLAHLVVNSPDWIMRVDESEAERLLQRLSERYRQVDAALKAEARADPSLFGMGTTLTLAYSLGNELFLAHVGDSRAYFCHEGKLHQLTRDHTYAQVLADTGVIRPEETATHRLRHVLTRALGATGDPVKADVHRARLSDGDQILLCTDGLTEMVEEEAIAAILQRAGAAQQVCQALVEAALDRGGRDNVTVVLARYRFEGDGE
jgi:protein phosphatase